MDRNRVLEAVGRLEDSLGDSMSAIFHAVNQQELADLRLVLEAAKAWEIAVSQLAEEDAEISEYVKQLEADKDGSDFEDTSGDEIAKEFERYLRRQDDSK